MDTHSFGARIRALRKARSLTQVQLAKAIGVSQNAISVVERGVGYPSIETAAAIAKVVGVPVADLFALLDETKLSKRRREMLAELLDVARALDEKSLAAAVEQVKARWKKA